VERRLSAILAADVVGYSALMEGDEAGTFERLRSHRKELFEPEIKAHRGRIFKLMGDGLLAEFASVVDAVQCAVALQRNMALRNEAIPSGQRISVRIGVNLGDVIIDGRDRQGEGVNIAARLEQLAEPGGICVSQSVVDQLSNKLPVGFISLGEHQVKNIARPVHVHAVTLDGKARPIGKATLPPKRRLALVAASLLAAIVLAGVALIRPWEDGKASINRMALPLPDKPSIAVLPFDYLGGDPQHAYFAAGMTEDLITDLSKLSGIFVIARNSSWTYKGKPVKVQQVAEDLGVRYVLEGSVRREGDQLRINAQLIDAIGGRHLWAERYDGSAKDVLAFQDKVVREIVAGLAISVTPEERNQFAEVETNVPLAYDAFLQGWDHYRRETKEDTTRAISFFEQAIGHDPQYSRAYAGLAAAYWRIVTLYWQPAVGIEYERAYAGLHQNLNHALENPTALAYSVSGELLARRGKWIEALGQIDRALLLSPNEANTHLSRARILNATGQAEDAEKAVRLAMRLNPHYAPDYLTVLGQSLLHQERYAEAAEFIGRAAIRQPDNDQHYVTLAIIHGHLGRIDDAQAAVRKFNSMAAKGKWAPMTVQEVGYWWYGNIFDYDEAYRERLWLGLRKAGVPEGAGSDITYAELKRLIRNSDGEYEVLGAPKIDREEAKALHSRGAVFVDVRNADSFGAGHIPSAANLEMSNVLSKESLSRLVGPDDDVVFYCFGKYCPRSTYACAKALLWGFKRVHYFAGGFPAWKDAGYPVDTSDAY
jgi:adenylate cyclase